MIYPLIYYRNIVISSGTGITTQGGSVTLDADTANGGGAIVMNASSSISSNGGAITLGGGSTPSTGYAYGDATYLNGIALNEATLNASGGAIILNGSAAAGSSATTTSGVYIYATTGTSLVETSGIGTITILGQGYGGSYSGGITTDNHTSITSQNGTISLTGSEPSAVAYNFAGSLAVRDRKRRHHDCGNYQRLLRYQPRHYTWR